MSIFDTFEKITAGMQKREVPMMHVVKRMDGQLVTLDNRRLGGLQDGKTCWWLWERQGHAGDLP